MDACAKAAGAVWPGPHNAALPCTRREAIDELRRLMAHPKPPTRPILVLGAYHAWPPVVWSMVRKLRRLTGADDAHILGIPYLWETTLQAAARKGVRRAIEKWGVASSGETAPIDVVGLSMGGLIARLVSAGDNAAFGFPADLPRLDARRIFTFGSPMQGSRRAAQISPDRAARDMRPGSTIIERVSAVRGPEIISYGQLRDKVVGATRTAPAGMEPIWSAGTIVCSHLTTPHNPWFLADMARRLRGEAPLLAPSSPPPRD